MNALLAPTADAVTTLLDNRWANLRETNRYVVRADGRASPARILLIKSGSVTLNYLLLRHFSQPQTPRVLRYAAYGIVVVANGMEYQAAWHNAHLPHGPRR